MSAQVITISGSHYIIILLLDLNVSTLNSTEEEISQSLDDREEHFDRKVSSPSVNVLDGNTKTNVLQGDSLSETSATSSSKKGFLLLQCLQR